MQPSLGLHHSHIRHHLDVPQHRGVKTFGLLFLLTDENVLTQEVLQGYSIFCLPLEQFLDELIEFLIADVFVNEFVDFLLIHVFNFDLFASEEPQPDTANVPHKFALLTVVVVILFGVVAILFGLDLLAPLADGVS
jgi:hypothetical protein